MFWKYNHIRVAPSRTAITLQGLHYAPHNPRTHRRASSRLHGYNTTGEHQHTEARSLSDAENSENSMFCGYDFLQRMQSG